MNIPGLRLHGPHAKTTALASARDWNYRIAFGWSGGKALDVDFDDYY
jgi:plasmid maintenance system killer protein